MAAEANKANKTKEIEDAIKLLNDNNYVVVPVSKGQMCLCDVCKEDDTFCRYCSYGYLCSNLVCINTAIKEQLDYRTQIAEQSDS